MKRHAEIVIVENDIPMAAKLSLTLNELGYRITGIFSRAKDALFFIEQEPPDLILLDDSLKGQLNGMESEGSDPKKETSIIYFNKEQSSQSIHKLLPSGKNISKGILKKEIRESFKRLRKKYSLKKSPKAEHSFLNDRIFVRYKDTMVKISLNEIQFIEADRNYCKVFTKDRQYLLVTTLKEVASKLPNKRFLRIHRSYIANLSHIDEIGGNHVVISGRSLPMSKNMRTELFKHLQVI
ncbi:LytR/AlgR family response regulator transcription factor [Christiangramia crocea]|uniref:Response regulator transcription factor n=1 Tax=Christiangramia crocea TaxID=2904124 RepID=A0A9X1UYL2_9FLAO|nr:LytTR family DNA-binding domain-containing protein [Gramella crocea]MCG9972732.1 response regulator transcription factor [Gramella crocea]